MIKPFETLKRLKQRTMTKENEPFALGGVENKNVHLRAIVLGELGG